MEIPIQYIGAAVVLVMCLLYHAYYQNCLLSSFEAKVVKVELMSDEEIPSKKKSKNTKGGISMFSF
jgi:hypothetical protein